MHITRPGNILRFTPVQGRHLLESTVDSVYLAWRLVSLLRAIALAGSHLSLSSHRTSACLTASSRKKNCDRSFSRESPLHFGANAMYIRPYVGLMHLCPVLQFFKGEGSMAIIKCEANYEEFDIDDGIRILVDRLWPRGISKDKAKLNYWLKEVAPSNELRKWYQS